MQEVGSYNPFLKVIYGLIQDHSDKMFFNIDEERRAEGELKSKILLLVDEYGINDLEHTASGETLLTDAIVEGYEIDVINKLLDCGASIYKYSQASPLLALMDTERPDKLKVAGLLLDVNNRDIRAKESNIRIANEQDSDCYTALHKAASDGDLGLCRLLITKGKASVALETLDNETPIDLAPQEWQKVLQDLYDKVKHTERTVDYTHRERHEPRSRDREALKVRNRDESPKPRGGHGRD